MKKQFFAATLIAAAIALSFPVGASAYSGSDDSDTVAPGGLVTYSALSGQEAGTDVTATLDGPDAGGATITLAATKSVSFPGGVKEGGRIDLAVKLPASASAGDVYTLAVAAGTFADTESFTVAALPADGTPADTAPTLPFTGAAMVPTLIVASGLVIFGSLFVLVYSTRKARQKQHVS